MWYCAMLLGIGAVLFCANTWGKQLEPVWTAAAQIIRRVQARSWVPIALAGFLGVATCGGHALLFGLPIPQVQDEFSYLLAADTFARGRLTNPSHPMWVHFETFHEIWKPTYASKYPPGQGLFLAIGQILTGKPIVGVWLSIGLACAAIAWMFQAIVARTYAAIGGLLIALHPIIINWGDRYWGGGVALLGGALACGAFLRLRSAIHTRYVLIFAAGLALLAITRPFEGLALAVPLVANVAWRVVRGTDGDRTRAAWTVLAPFLLCAALLGSWIGYYNLKVTGHVLEMPYQEHAKQYEEVPVLLWLPLLPDRTYRHRDLQRQSARDYERYEKERSLSGFAGSIAEKLHIVFGAATGFEPLWVLSFIALPLAAAKARMIRLLTAILAFWLFMVIWETYFHNHYAAPVLPLIFALGVIGFEQLCQTRLKDRPFGRWVAGISALVFIASVPAFHFVDAHEKLVWASRRAEIKQTLQDMPGKQLVVVHYSPDHIADQEWIYNRANVDQSKIVWARDMGPKNIELLNYFSDRTVWLVNADAGEPQLQLLRPAREPAARHEAADAEHHDRAAAMAGH